MLRKVLQLPWRCKLVKKIEWIIEKNNIKYYDFSNNFNDKDFVDYDHLNKSGVNKLIKLIKQNQNNECFKLNW